MRLIATALILLAACSSCAHTPLRSAAQQYNATVTIKVTCFDESIHYGTGVLVSENQVLTANHVAGCSLVDGLPFYVGADKIEVYPSPDKLVVATAELTVPGADVARLKLEEALPEYFTAVDVGAPPELGDRLCIVSAVPTYVYRCGEAQEARSGTVRFSIMTEHGNSGSAVYNSRGQLVGIVTDLIRCQDDIPCMGWGAALAGYTWLVPES